MSKSEILDALYTIRHAVFKKISHSCGEPYRRLTEDCEMLDRLIEAVQTELTEN